MELAAELNQFSRWRLAAVIAAAVALLELVLLLGVAGIKLAPSLHHHAAATPAQQPVTHPVTRHSVIAFRVPAAHGPLRTRSHLSVLVLNGNGVAGTAGALAQRLLGDGYRRTVSTNAPSHDYATSLVLYAPGYEREAHRLGRDARIRTVATGDGRLRGYRLVVILGGS